MRKRYGYIIVGFVATIFAYIGKEDAIWHRLSNAELLSATSAARFQQFLFIFGILISGLVLPIKLTSINHRLSKKEEAFQELLSHNKDAILKLLYKETGISNSQFRVSVFKPLKGWYNYLIKGEPRFGYTFLKGVSDSTNCMDLSFLASSENPEGLIGKAVVKKGIEVDYDMGNQNSYQLTPGQKQSLSSIAFWVAVPIFDKKSKVVAVLSVHTETPLELIPDKRSLLYKHLIFLAAFIDKHHNFS